MRTIRLKSNGTSTYDDINKKIDMLKEKFSLGYNNIQTMEDELLKIKTYVNEGISLSSKEKTMLIDKIEKIKQSLPELNKQRNLPYNKSINTIRLLEEDFLEDSFWRPTPKELEQSYVRVLNILKTNNELTDREKTMLKEYVLQKISEIPELSERRDQEEKTDAINRKIAIENAKERYKKQSFFVKAKQLLITKQTPKDLKSDLEIMDLKSIDELYTQKKR